MNSYTAIVKKSGEWWIGRRGSRCQRTKGKEDESLKEVLAEALEFNRGAPQPLKKTTPKNSFV